jgi:hypothetical protein
MHLLGKVLLWLFLATVLWFFSVSAYVFCVGKLNVPTLYALKTHGILTQAEVTKLTSEDHGTYHYSYVVANKTYEGIGSSDDLLKPSVGKNTNVISKIAIGTKVNIHYLPDDPATSCAGDVSFPWINRTAIGWGLYIVPSLVVLLFSMVFWKKPVKRVKS